MGATGTSRLNESTLDDALREWLDLHAESLDTSAEAAGAVLSRLGATHLFRVGVPLEDNGRGGGIVDAIAIIAAVAEHSVTAAFVFWAQRTFIEYLLRGTNKTLRERWLPALLDGSHAGATGLSNAMKFLSGIESLQIRATAADDTHAGWSLQGKLPWVTNLRADGFIVAAAVAHDDNPAAASIFAIPHDADGVVRSPDLDLMGLRGSNTAALRLERVQLDRQWQIHADAQTFLRQVRPSFLGMQCALSIGLARRSLVEARRLGDSTRSALGEEIEAAEATLDKACKRLATGIASGIFQAKPTELFEIRIQLADCAHRAVYLELQASGGRSYLRQAGYGFERRWREAAFIPIVTPSLVQLKGQLSQHASDTAA